MSLAKTKLDPPKFKLCGSPATPLYHKYFTLSSLPYSNRIRPARLVPYPAAPLPHPSGVHPLFTERSEITINYKDPADLEKEIKDRVKRLLNANVVETVPLSQSLDEELGVFEAEPTLAEELEDLLSVEDSEVEGEEDGGDELE
jgi:hypothetical protein